MDGKARSAKLVAAFSLWVLVGLPAPPPSAATVCLDESDPGAAGDAAQIAELQLLIFGDWFSEDPGCPCFFDDLGPGQNRRAYLDCVMSRVEQAIADGRLRRECRATVRRMHSRSTCGREYDRGWSVCLARPRDGSPAIGVGCTVRPLLRKDGVSQTGRCESDAQVVREACPGFTHCIDAADTNRDLRIGELPEDSGRCPVCGDGVIEATEECDGGTFCTANCLLAAPLCCPVSGGICIGGSGQLSGIGPLWDWVNCYRVIGQQSVAGACVPTGGSCPPDLPVSVTCGTCQVQSIPPTELCCQTGSTCTGTTATDTAALAGFGCETPPLGSGWLVLGTCGEDGRCRPAGS